MEIFDHKPQIILISGKARHGKTTSALIMKEIYESLNKKVIITRYSTYIKHYAKEFFGWDGREETKPRELLQKLGTDVIRKMLGKDDFFVKRMVEDIEIMKYFFDVIIIDDVRFPIEIELLKTVYPEVKTIRINRLNFVSDLTQEQQKHITETSLDEYKDFNQYLLNDSNLEGLKEKLNKLIRG
ncbi:MAG: hypothetical protein GX641_00700 [Mollicutes bacterium]|nr:hypothetical protein [Mollicutes bacterium]